MTIARKPQDQDKFVLRFPHGLREKIADLAARNNRSMNAEMIGVLERAVAQGKIGEGPHAAADAAYVLDLMAEYTNELRAYLSRLSAPTESGVPASGISTTQNSKGLDDAGIEFYERLKMRFPDLVAPLQAFVAELQGIGIQALFQRSLILRWYPKPRQAASAGYIEASGSAWLGDAVSAATKLGKQMAGEAYLQSVAQAVGGKVRYYENSSSAPQVLNSEGEIVSIADLLEQKGDWITAIVELNRQLKQAD